MVDGGKPVEVGAEADLIPLTSTDEGITAVMGRDLHEFLGIKEPYTDWFKRMVGYGFVAGQEFDQKNLIGHDSLGRKREIHNHVMTLDMAKEISMIQRTDKGKIARRYFIEVEKKYREQAAKPQFELPQTFSDALRMRTWG